MTLPPQTALERPVWGVGALLQAASDALWARLGPVAVRGELSGFSRAASGHWYFSLKDDAGAPSLVRCAMFRRATALVDFAPAEGQKVELRGRLDLYAARGDLQLIVESMARVGQGSLYEEFLRLRARLQLLGLFDAERKRPLPPHPASLGLVTSLGAAALHDVLSALARRAPQVAAVVYPCLVQGAEAPASIVAALAAAGQRCEVDALLLVRGGGSLEDLWSFNDERVVRAIVECPLPVVCGVGHETDITLADLAADLRAPTPTAAAEMAAPARAELLMALGALALRLRRAQRHRLDRATQGLDLLAARLAGGAALIQPQRQRLALLAQRAGAAAARQLEHTRMGLAPLEQRWHRARHLSATLRRDRLAALGGRLGLLDPQRVLERGYAWLETAAGEVVLSPAQVQAGHALKVSLAQGQLDLVPEQVRLRAR